LTYTAAVVDNSIRLRKEETMRMTPATLHVFVPVVVLTVFSAGCGDFAMYVNNATFLEQSVDRAAQETVRQLDLPAGTSVALVNADNPIDIDVQPNSKFYDAFIKALLRAEMKPVERDADILVRLANEGRDTLLMSATTHNDGPTNQFSWDARAETRQLATGMEEAEPVDVVATETERYTAGGVKPEEGVRTTYGGVIPKPESQTSVPGAEKLLAYRIKECGIRYGFGPGDELQASEGYTRRNARVALNARVVDAKSGIVERYADVDSVVHDYVLEGQIRMLEEHMYENFDHLYPSVRISGETSVESSDADIGAATQAGMSRMRMNSIVVGGSYFGPVIQYMRRLGQTGPVIHSIAVGAQGFFEEREETYWNGWAYETHTDDHMEMNGKLDYMVEFAMGDVFRLSLRAGLWGDDAAVGGGLRFRFNEFFEMELGGDEPMAHDMKGGGPILRLFFNF
jgi:hypothetical protein